MAKSKLIKDITTNSISVEEGLQRALIITYDLDNEPLQRWLQNELNGYSIDEELPLYRKKIQCVTYYSGFHGHLNITHQPLPSGYVDSKLRDLITETDIKEAIRVIERVVKTNETMAVPLTDLAGHIAAKTGVRCYRIFKEISISSFEEIMSKVKNKLIMILLDLEKEFGDLDSLDIDVTKLNGKKTEELNDKLNSRIYYDGKSEGITFD